MKDLIVLKNISKKYLSDSPVSVLQNISLNIKDGEFFVFVGPSGSGKSTLLRIMSGLDHEFKGSLKIDPKLDIGFVFQQFALLPWLSVYENIVINLLSKNITK